MLDHLSYGRLEVGVGRGVSPFELKYHKVEHDQSRDIFIDAFNCISAGLDHREPELFRHALQLREGPDRVAAAAAAAPRLLVRLLQYDRLDLGGRAWAAFRHARSGADRQGQYRGVQGGAWPSAAAPAQPKAEFPGGAAIGVQRHIFVADTDAEAKRFAKPAMERPPRAISTGCATCTASTGVTSRLNVPRGADYRGLRRRRHGDRRQPRDGSRGDRAAGARARRELPAHLPVSRHDDAHRRAAIAAAVLNRGDAEDRASLTAVRWPFASDCAKFRPCDSKR